jgi:hypothetical protein
VPALPWTTVNSPSEPAGVCTVFAAQLPLRFHRHMPRLLWLTVRIRRQLPHVPGLLGYAFDLEIRHKTLWTSSAWSHRTGLAGFDQAVPHQTAKQALERHPSSHIRRMDLPNRSATRTLARDARAPQSGQ